MKKKSKEWQKFGDNEATVTRLIEQFFASKNPKAKGPLCRCCGYWYINHDGYDCPIGYANIKRRKG